MRRLVVIPGDPIFKYYEKGEIKARYWNSCGLFDEVHILSLSESDIEPEKVQALVGDAKLYIHAVGRPTALTLAFYYFKITRIIRRLNPDLIRAHGPWHSGSLGAFAGKRLGIPCIGSIHNDIDIMRRYERQILLRLVEPLVQYTFRNASVILCVSNYLHKLDTLNAAHDINDLRSPPGNRLHALRGKLRGSHSIRVNDQWRIVFRWSGSTASDVRLTDYH